MKFLLYKIKNWKRKMTFLKNKVEIILKEKMTYLSLLRKRKRILININLFVRAKALILLLTKMNFWISKNVLMFWIPLWKGVHLIWTNLILCFQKKKPKENISHTHHEKHAQHAHTHQHKHAFMYGKVYTYAHCGRKGHLAKFYYTKLNMLNKNIWVRESTNPLGPKNIWVPKNTPNLIDVGVSSSSKT